MTSNKEQLSSLTNLCTIPLSYLGSVSTINLEKLLEYTGYEKGTEHQPSNLGKWFKLDKNRKELPGFISNRSYQRSPYG